ncbi:hypothetical protein SELMODRAFT_438279 [Selaginella moellendorffii]|uniref:Uncharacterized protein n=1 Tax=Selaginella moellendorffii TaxID=88036 RepID=D8QVM5_SELML|nr:hypothetical protein SELMODRAFT_438279 [Selaginella moellendorffii]
MAVKFLAISGNRQASAFGIGSSGAKLRSGLGCERVFCGRCCSRLVAPSLWMRWVGAGTSCVRANSKNQSESTALDDPDALASRDSMEDGGGNVRGSVAGEKNHESVETEGEEKRPVWISRGSLEDTGGSDASEVLETFTGTDQKNDGVRGIRFQSCFCWKFMLSDFKVEDPIAMGS